MQHSTSRDRNASLCPPDQGFDPLSYPLKADLDFDLFDLNLMLEGLLSDTTNSSSELDLMSLCCIVVRLFAFAADVDWGNLFLRRKFRKCFDYLQRRSISFPKPESRAE